MELSVTVAVLLFCGILAETQARNFYVAAPKSLRLNAEETIAIAMDGTNSGLVNVYVQDHPQKTKKIVQIELELQPEKPKIFNLQLDPKEFPPNFFSSPGHPKLVSLTANFQGFSKEIVIPIASQSGYMFIQTDKPIYTPRQVVMFRMIPLSEEIRESKEPFQLVIKNPKNITVEEKNFNDKNRKIRRAFVSHIYKFPSHPLLGEWSATVRYGHNMEQNSTIHFTVKEYVVPIFTVELTTPDTILPNDETIEVAVDAKYVYGKKVKGIVNFRLGVKKPKSLTADIFGEITGQELDDGFYNLKISTDAMKKLNTIGWFPGIEGSYLFVEATVVDAATGNSETASDVKARFSKSPFVISFDRCLKDFKPGMTSVFEADVTYVGGRPTNGIMTKIKAVADNGKVLYIAHDTAVSDENGKVTYEIQPEMHHKKVTITLETIDEKYEGSQAKETFEQEAYSSPNDAYLAISRSNPQRLRPGDMFGKEIHFQPPQMKDIYYMVIAKGKILQIYKLPPGAFKTQKVEFPITYDMVPSFRVVAFAHYRNELVVDSLKIDVESFCHPDAEVKINPVYDVKEPGSNGKIVITGTKDSTVGLLGVDEAIYALSKRDLLTKAKLFNTLTSHDLGCGSGGGLTAISVLGNAGITMGTNIYTPNGFHSCVEKIRKKREVADDSIADKYEGVERDCCLLIQEPNKFNRTCEERADIIHDRMKESVPTCRKVFIECCRAVEDEADEDYGWYLGRNLDNVPVEFIIRPDMQQNMMKELTVRSDFRETWIFEDIIIGPDGREEVGASLPHSITTWVLHAVSLSPENGMCVADPEKIESFKQIFLHLNLPYSVVRNEQVEIQATVFNYGGDAVYAYVSMFGTDDLCSGSLPGQQSEVKTVKVESQSAATVTFSVIPMEVKDYPIKVYAMTTKGSDAIERLLHVVPEGITKEIDIPVKLDPTNLQRRQKRHINTEHYSDQIDPTQNLQVTAIKLGAPEGFVPGTASCYITAMGDSFGPAVETSVNNPEGLLRMPGGCGEQNMMGLAPTVYSLNYLKASGKLTANIEQKGYEFIRHGYGNELQFRHEDGSYSTFKNSGSSTWLTAFVMKVFCQASKFIFIDRNVLCSGVNWLIKNQGADGGYIEKTNLWHKDMMGGVNGKTPLTAFVLIAMSECDCDEQNLMLAKQRSVAYLEAHLNEVTTPLPTAIVAYALALGDSDKKQVAIEKLLALAKYDPDTNQLRWPTASSAQDIETGGYALLALLRAKDMGRCDSIVNWLNTKQLQSGAFKSTQDTVVALQALSEYAIQAKKPVMNLVTNITSSNDKNFYKTLIFNEENTLMLQDAIVDNVGGTIFIRTAGQGMGTLTAKLSYNMIVPIEDICKFEVTVHVTEKKRFVPEKDDKPIGKVFEAFPEDVFLQVKNDMGKPPAGFDQIELEAEEEPFNRRVKRQNPEGKEQYALNIALCVRYLGNKEAGMSIVDVGTFSGFEPYIRDLRKLQDDPNHLIQRYETSSRGVVFYLDKVPNAASYCFNYHVLRKFFVGNTQMSAIKVYDYYNPDETCTKFYSPDNDSPMLRTICEDDGVCECAEGGCPPDKPFAMFNKERDVKKKREKILASFCETYDYVWKGQLKEAPTKKGNGFLNISFVVSDVIKAGIEKEVDIKGETRTLLTRDNCKAPFVGTTYLIAGNDGKAYKNARGEIWYRYMLDKTSIIYLYSNNAVDPKLQRDLEHVTKTLKEKGCDL